MARARWPCPLRAAGAWDAVGAAPQPFS